MTTPVDKTVNPLSAQSSPVDGSSGVELPHVAIAVPARLASAAAAMHAQASRGTAANEGQEVTALDHQDAEPARPRDGSIAGLPLPRHPYPSSAAKGPGGRRGTRSSSVSDTLPYSGASAAGPPSGHSDLDPHPGGAAAAFLLDAHGAAAGLSPQHGAAPASGSAHARTGTLAAGVAPRTATPSARGRGASIALDVAEAQQQQQLQQQQAAARPRVESVAGSVSSRPHVGSVASAPPQQQAQAPELLFTGVTADGVGLGGLGAAFRAALQDTTAIAEAAAEGSQLDATSGGSPPAGLRARGRLNTSTVSVRRISMASLPSVARGAAGAGGGLAAGPSGGPQTQLPGTPSQQGTALGRGHGRGASVFHMPTQTEVPSALETPTAGSTGTASRQTSVGSLRDRAGSVTTGSGGKPPAAGLRTRSRGGSVLAGGAGQDAAGLPPQGPESASSQAVAGIAGRDRSGTVTMRRSSLTVTSTPTAVAREEQQRLSLQDGLGPLPGLGPGSATSASTAVLRGASSRRHGREASAGSGGDAADGSAALRSRVSSQLLGGTQPPARSTTLRGGELAAGAAAGASEGDGAGPGASRSVLSHMAAAVTRSMRLGSAATGASLRALESAAASAMVSTSAAVSGDPSKITPVSATSAMGLGDMGSGPGVRETRRGTFSLPSEGVSGAMLSAEAAGAGPPGSALEAAAAARGVFVGAPTEGEGGPGDGIASDAAASGVRRRKRSAEAVLPAAVMPGPMLMAARPTAAAPAVAAAAASVDAHVAERAGRARRTARHSWSLPYRAWRWVFDRVIMTLQFGLAVVLVLLALLFQFLLPDRGFGDNPAYKWLYLCGGTVAVLFPLRAAEWAFFALLERVKGAGSVISEVVDFAGAANGHLAHICAVIFALLLKYVLFQLQFSDAGNFWFVRTCAALIFFKAFFFVGYNVVLKIILRAIYTSKHRKRVEDCLFHVESARFLTAPTPLQMRLYEEWLAEQRRLEAEMVAARSGAGEAGKQHGRGWRSKRRVTSDGGVAAGGKDGRRAGAAAGTLAADTGAAAQSSKPLEGGDAGSSKTLGALTSAVSARNRLRSPPPVLALLDSQTGQGDDADPDKAAAADGIAALQRALSAGGSMRSGSEWQTASGAGAAGEEGGPELLPHPAHPQRLPWATEPPIPVALEDFASLQRVGSPTYLLDSDSFWTQLAYVRSRYFSLYSGRARLCDVASGEAVEEFAKSAFDRLAAEKLALERLRLKAALLAALERDREQWYAMQEAAAAEAEAAAAEAEAAAAAAAEEEAEAQRQRAAERARRHERRRRQKAAERAASALPQRPPPEAPREGAGAEAPHAPPQRSASHSALRRDAGEGHALPSHGLLPASRAQSSAALVHTAGSSRPIDRLSPEAQHQLTLRRSSAGPAFSMHAAAAAAAARAAEGGPGRSLSPAQMRSLSGAMGYGGDAAAGGHTHLSSAQLQQQQQQGAPSTHSSGAGGGSGHGGGMLHNLAHLGSAILSPVTLFEPHQLISSRADAEAEQHSPAVSPVPPFGPGAAPAAAPHQAYPPRMGPWAPGQQPCGPPAGAFPGAEQQGASARNMAANRWTVGHGAGSGSIGRAVGVGGGRGRPSGLVPGQRAALKDVFGAPKQTEAAAGTAAAPSAADGAACPATGVSSPTDASAASSAPMSEARISPAPAFPAAAAVTLGSAPAAARPSLLHNHAPPSLAQVRESRSSSTSSGSTCSSSSGSSRSSSRRSGSDSGEEEVADDGTLLSPVLASLASAGAAAADVLVVTLALDPANFYCELPRSLGEISDVPDVARWERLRHALDPADPGVLVDLSTLGTDAPDPAAAILSPEQLADVLHRVTEFQRANPPPPALPPADSAAPPSTQQGTALTAGKPPAQLRQTSSFSSATAIAAADAAAPALGPVLIRFELQQAPDSPVSMASLRQEPVLAGSLAQFLAAPEQGTTTQGRLSGWGRRRGKGHGTHGSNPLRFAAAALRRRDPLPHEIPTVMRIERMLVELAQTAPSLLLDDVRPCFTSEEDAGAAFRLLDQDADGSVTRDEFAAALVVMFNHWVATQSAVASFGGISGAISILANIVRWIITLLVILAIYDISFNAVYVPFTTILVGFAFMVGLPVQKMLDGLVFTLVVVPYDVGDTVAVNIVNGNASMTVRTVSLYTTEFIDGSNRFIVVRNSELLGAAITNLRRSGDAVASVKVMVDQGITGAQVAALKERVKEYAKRNGVTWKPKPGLSISGGDGNKCELTVTMTHRSSWQEGKVGGDQSLLVAWLLDTLREMGLRYSLPPQQMQVSVSGVGDSNHAGAAAAATAAIEAAARALSAQLSKRAGWQIVRPPGPPSAPGGPRQSGLGAGSVTPVPSVVVSSASAAAPARPLPVPAPAAMRK